MALKKLRFTNVKTKRINEGLSVSNKRFDNLAHILAKYFAKNPSGSRLVGLKAVYEEFKPQTNEEVVLMGFYYSATEDYLAEQARSATKSFLEKLFG